MSSKPPVTDWAHDFDHTDPTYVADPYPIWEELREKCPIAHSDRYGGTWLPVDHADVSAIAYDTELTQQLVGGTDEYLARVAERLTGTGVRVNRRSLVGHGVAATLIDAASEEGADLIVMATRGRGGLGRLGSVADKVMRGAPCPVLLDRRRRR